MRSIANILWHFPFFGFITAINTFIIGVILLLTIVGAPIGLGLIQHSKFLMRPFSSEMIRKSYSNRNYSFFWWVFSFIIRILYIPFGMFLASSVLFHACLMFMSIIGIPNAIVLFKSIPTYFNPVHKICVRVN